MEAITVHSCVLSFQLVRTHWASPAPTEYLGSFRPTPSGLLKLPLDTSSYNLYHSHHQDALLSNSSVWCQGPLLT